MRVPVEYKRLISAPCKIENVDDCQSTCQYFSSCNFFFFDNGICKLYRYMYTRHTTLSLSSSVFYHLLARIIGQAVSLLVGHLVRKLRNVWERILGIVMCSSKRIVNIKVQTQDFHPPMEKLWMKLHVEICVKSLKTLDANIGHLRSFYLF